MSVEKLIGKLKLIMDTVRTLEITEDDIVRSRRPAICWKANVITRLRDRARTGRA